MQNTLTDFYENDYKNIVYPNTREVPLKNGKPTCSWMKNWSLDERLDKFFEFCRGFDERDDMLLREDYQIFSHRLHWHEHSFVDLMQNVTDNRDRLWYTLVFSFSNEHWGTLTKLMNEGIEACRSHFENNRHARNDLFQIYYPKNTNVKEWLLEGPLKAANDMHHILNDISKPYTMMGFAKLLEAYFKKYQNFRSPLYPCKNTARYIAMAYPHLVDPESILFGGTGHFDGLQQIFNSVYLNGKVKYSINSDGEFISENKYADMWLEQMTILANDHRNPIREQMWLNLEDKTCFQYKHIAISHGVKSPTKRIPYNWIFANDFDLAKRSDGKKVFIS
jgi:hypothetical protein